ncbi:MAG: DinB family protein [Calditrichaeota bacterium]|nr:MAG: DinB family protein [Calditrichota bacterium]
MEKFYNLLEEALEAWGNVRNGLMEEVKNIPAEQFDFKPNSDVRSVRELIVHILEVAMMMTGELTRRDTDFHRAPWPELLDMYAREAYALQTKEECIGLLKKQFEEALEKFKEVGELHMLQFIKRFDGKPGTRLAWLQHGIAHEMYHRGQLVLYERLLGIEPALTRRIRES